MSTIGAIPAFVAVVQGGGFSSAARTLGVTKSAVSKRINLLEEELGARLLYRTTRKLSLTEAGERYYEHAQKALAAASDAEDAVAQLHGEPQGKLKISCPMSFGRLHVAPLIPKLLLRYPKLDIELIMDDRPVDLISEGIDIAIRTSFGSLPDSELVAKKLAPLRQGVYASPSYLQSHPMPEFPSDLAGHNCILFSVSSDGNHWAFIGQKNSETVEVSGNYRVNNSEAILAAIKEGIGVARLPSYIANRYLNSGELIELLPDYRIPEHSFFAVYPQRQYLPAKVRAFIDFATEYYGEEKPYWDK